MRGQLIAPEVVNEASGGRGFLDRVADGIASRWMSPGEPMRVVAPAGTVPRQWDFPVGSNLRTTPRVGEGKSFQLLRDLAEHCTVLRAGIETCKTRTLRFRYTVQPIREGGSDQGAAEVQAVLDRPDLRRPFQQWGRMVLEDSYVLDAIGIAADRNRGGKVMALAALDGATIEPKIDLTGRMPLEGVAYQQILKGVPAVDFQHHELVYWVSNPRTNRRYGYSPVEQAHIIANLCIRQEVAELQEFTDGTIPPLLIGLPESMNKEDRAAFAAWWSSQYEGNSAARHQAMFVPMGDKMQLHELADRKFNRERHEWAVRLVTFVLNLSPAWGVQMMNRATAEQLSDTAVEEGDLPRAEDFAALLTECVHRFWGYTHLRVVPEDTRKSDTLKEAQEDEILIRSGVKSPDEARKKRGLPDDGVACGRIMMTTAGPVPLAAIVEPLGESDGDVVEGEVVTQPGEAVQDSALNGAQITALLEICAAVSDGVLTEDAAVATILVAFPTIDEKEARRIVAGVEERETPPPDPNAPPQLPGPGDGDDPEASDDDENDDDPEDDGDGKEGKGLGAAKAAGLRKRRPTVATLSAKARKLRASRLLAAKATRKAERGTARRMARTLKAVMHDVVKQVAPELGKLRKDEAADRAKELTALLDLSGFDVLIDPTATTLARIAESGARTAVATVTAVAGTAESIELDNAPVLAFTRARAAELVGKRVLDDGTIVDNPNPKWAITDGTRDLVRGTITQAFQEQWSRDQLIDALEQSYAFSTTRATTIARTEITRALVDGNVEGWRQSGVVEGKSWILGSEHDDDDECLVGGTLVRSGEAMRGFERAYSGDLIELHLANGRQLTGTPNHPMLTDAGWKPLGLLQEGDHLISDAILKRIPAIADDFDHVESRLEDVVRAVGGGATALPTAAGEFHGDGVGSEVHIVRTHRPLDHPRGGVFDQGEEARLALGANRAYGFAGLRRSLQPAAPYGWITAARNRGAGVLRAALECLQSCATLLIGGISPAGAGGFVGSGGLGATLFWRGLRHRHAPCLAQAARRVASAPQAAAHGGVAQANKSPDLFRRALLAEVQAHQLGCGHAHRVAVRGIRRYRDTVAVFNLSTPHGFYVAEGVIASNCDMAMADGIIPLDATFSNGVTAPPAHPRCSCDILPSLTEASA